MIEAEAKVEGMKVVKAGAAAAAAAAAPQLVASHGRLGAAISLNIITQK